MKINKKYMERKRIVAEIKKIVEEMQKITDARGLKLTHNYFASYLGINKMSFHLMLKGNKVPHTLQGKLRLARLTKLKEEILAGKIPL